MSISSIGPTFSGYVANTHDAILLFQAAITGVLPLVPRRPHDRERAELIQSGSVFIFNEHNSGIKRWTDGIAWSPSRILGNFLIYRQLEKPFSPGEKKRTFRQQRNRRKQSTSVDTPHPYGREALMQQQSRNNGRGDSIIDPTTGIHYQATGRPPMHNDLDMMNKYRSPGNAAMAGGVKLRSDMDGKTDDRHIVGSLTDTYRFKEDGLVKKTISIQYQNQAYHLVSYYLPDDVRNNAFMVPSRDPRLKDLQISEELLQTRHFRVALDSEESDPSSQFAAMNMGKRELQDRVSHQQAMSTGMPGFGLSGPGAGGLYGFSGTNGHDGSQQGRAMNAMGRAMDMPYEMDMNGFDQNTGYQQQAIYYNRGQQAYQLGGLQPQPGHPHQQSQQPHSVNQMMMDGSLNSTYGKSPTNNYISGYRPFAASQLPAPPSANSNGLPPPLPQSKVQVQQSPSQQQQQQQQPLQSRHNASGRLSTNTPSSISQPDMYQYSSSLQLPSYQYSATSQPSSSVGSSNSISATSSSRRSSVATGANSPSLPPMIQSQSYSYSNYGHDYTGTGSTSTTSASDPRRLPGTPSGARPPMGAGEVDSSSGPSGINEGNTDSPHLNGPAQKLYQVPTTANQGTNATTQGSLQQGSNGYNYGYGNYTSIANW
ncbi:Mit1p [Sugiyamaella lignohabitans]|uniref:Mit1p n=1 Tax=Sugiyamaella lignohabitans TaxID=796027 RepID=A0A167FWW1_9ASCO|nr:Mit1p [Sugiyamaella lignohabitans]ANB15804.1 Mit1p [Sugiyamaella lignohabitans]